MLASMTPWDHCRAARRTCGCQNCANCVLSIFRVLDVVRNAIGRSPFQASLELSGGSSENSRDPDQGPDSGELLAGLDVAHVGSIDFGEASQIFLAQADAVPAPADSLSEKPSGPLGFFHRRGHVQRGTVRRQRIPPAIADNGPNRTLLAISAVGSPAGGRVEAAPTLDPKCRIAEKPPRPHLSAGWKDVVANSA